MIQYKKILMTLALLLTAVGGAWADWTGGTYTATTNEELGAIIVGADATLTINEGVTVTVSGGINANGTLTVKGAGMLTVTGANGADGANSSEYDGGGGGNGSAGFTGTLIVDGATVNVTGGNGGNGGSGFQYGGSGGKGAAGVSGSITLNIGSVTVTGGAGGNGGSALMQGGSRGSAGQAVTGTITASTAEESDDNSTWTAISGSTSSKRYVRAESTAPAVEVIINDTKTEASFKMPQYDVDATYTIKRDMTVDVTATIDDRIRIKKDGNDYQPVGKEGDIDASAALPTVTDNLDAEAPVTMTEGTDKDYTLTLQKQSETDETVWTDVTAYSVGNFRYKITGTGNYSGVIYTDPFELFEGYQVVIPAGEYVTYYKDEAVRLDEADRESIELYTVSSVSETTATLSGPYDAMPKNTPMFVRNKGTEDKTFYLIPCNDPDLALSVYSGFQGTLEPTTIAASTSTVNNYAFNGTAFVWVKNALEVGANKCWLSIGASSARTLNIVFDDATGVKEVIEVNEVSDNSWYDLSGRKLQGKPNRKGVYIMNGRKVVVK